MARKTDRRKQSLYIPGDMLAEMKHESQRQGRSLSWAVQRAWEISRRTICSYPDPPTITEPVE